MRPVNTKDTPDVRLRIPDTAAQLFYQHGYRLMGSSIHPAFAYTWP